MRGAMRRAAAGGRYVIVDRAGRLQLPQAYRHAGPGRRARVLLEDHRRLADRIAKSKRRRIGRHVE
jgi:hypothetical protein